MILRSEVRYNQLLQRLLKSLHDDIETSLLLVIERLQPEYVQDAWPDEIKAILEALMIKWTSDDAQEIFNQIALGFIRTTLSEVDRGLGFDVIETTPELRNILQAAAIQNADLIKSIPQQYLDRVSNTVYAGMRTGLRHEAIAEQLLAQFNITQRRAEFIARDQAGKINGELTKQRQIDAGFVYFKWLTSHDERVRPSHVKLGQQDVGFGPGIYRWNDLPIDPDTGQPTQPGQPYNCRCVAKAIQSSKIAKQKNVA